MRTNLLDSSFLWRLFICLMAALGLCCSVFVFHSKNLTGPNITGGLGIKVSKESRFGSTLFVIDSISQSSPLSQAGLKQGDLIEFENYHHWHGTRHPGEHVGITIVAPGQSRKLDVVSVPVLTLAKAGLTIVSLVVGFIASVLGVVVALKRSEDRALRALSLFLILFQFNFMRYVALPGKGMDVAQYAWASTIWLIWGSLTYFATKYQDENLGPFRARLSRILRPLAVMTVLATGYSVWGVTHSIPNFELQTTIASNIIGIVVLIALWEGWGCAHGEARQRHLWILVLFGIRTIISFPTYFSFILAPTVFEVTVWVHRLGTLAFCIGFAYSVLRHRVLNFQFAVNRTLVFTVTSLLLFLAFWLIEQLVHQLVHFEALESNGLLSGGIAFGLFFTFNRVHHRVEHWVEHLFFRQWRDRDSALRAFVKKAEHFTESSALITAFGAALDRFNSGGGNAIYLVEGDGEFECMYSSLGNAPKVIEKDDDIAVSLRASRQATRLADTNARLPAELALPVLQGGVLKGLILLGAKPEAQAYRPDEKTLLEFAAAQIGLDLSRLRGGRLTEQLQAAQRNMALHQHEQFRLQEALDSLRRELDSVKQERATLMLALSKIAS